MIKLQFSRRISLLLVFVVGTGIITWGAISKPKPNLKAKTLAAYHTPTLDLQLLAKLSEASKQFDPNQKELLLVATVSVNDAADSSQTMTNMPYVFSKKGENLYFKIGQTEMFNANGRYILVDHLSKKVLLGPQKPVIPAIGIPDVTNLLKTLDGEGYTLAENITKNGVELSLKNDYHLSCKEFKIGLNTSKQLQRIYMRVSNDEYPEDKNKDKRINIQVSKCSKDSELNTYLGKTIVEKQKSGWTLTTAYQNYELILM